MGAYIVDSRAESTVLSTSYVASSVSLQPGYTGHINTLGHLTH